MVGVSGGEGAVVSAQIKGGTEAKAGGSEAVGGGTADSLWSLHEMLGVGESPVR